MSGEFPNVIEKTEYLPLSYEQQIRYREVLNARNHSTVGAWIRKFNELRDICDLDPETSGSSKISRAKAIVDAVRRLKEKVVVFSYKIRPLSILERELSEEHGKDSLAMITGRTSSTERAKIVSVFQASEQPFVLLCSTRATAEGLTLTAANHVVFINEWWNPALNRQARDRVNRIGQTREVFVYRLRTKGTVESTLDDILSTKSKLFDEVVEWLSRDSHYEEAVPSAFVELLQPGTSNLTP